MTDQPLGRAESLHEAYERLDGERRMIDGQIRRALTSGPTEDLGRALRAGALAGLYRDLAGVFFQLQAVAVADVHLHPSYVEVIAWAQQGAKHESALWAANERAWRESMEEAGRRAYRETSRLEALAGPVDLDDLGTIASPAEIRMMDEHVADVERRRAAGEAP